MELEGVYKDIKSNLLLSSGIHIEMYLTDGFSDFWQVTAVLVQGHWGKMGGGRIFFIKQWNSLLPNVVCAPSLEVFKKRLDSCLSRMV